MHVVFSGFVFVTEWNPTASLENNLLMDLRIRWSLKTLYHISTSALCEPSLEKNPTCLLTYLLTSLLRYWNKQRQCEFVTHGKPDFDATQRIVWPHAFVILGEQKSSACTHHPCNQHQTTYHHTQTHRNTQTYITVAVTSRMTYIVSRGALNSTHSLSILAVIQPLFQLCV